MIRVADFSHSPFRALVSAAQLLLADHVARGTVSVVAPVEGRLGGVSAAAGDGARLGAPGGSHLALSPAGNLEGFRPGLSTGENPRCPRLKKVLVGDLNK